MSKTQDETHDLAWHLEQAANEPDLDAIEIGSNMGSATLEQLHQIVAFAEKLKLGALAEMWGREREAKGLECSNLELPPEGYTGWHSLNGL